VGVSDGGGGLPRAERQVFLLVCTVLSVVGIGALVLGVSGAPVVEWFDFLFNPAGFVLWVALSVVVALVAGRALGLYYLELRARDQSEVAGEDDLPGDDE
jgi:hypothetical protein